VEPSLETVFLVAEFRELGHVSGAVPSEVAGDEGAGMRTVQQARLILPGTRQRIYDIDLVELDSGDANRFLVNFRYGWQGAALEEGTRTPDAVSEDAAVRIFESLILARKNQGYVPQGAAADVPRTPTLSVVADVTNPRDLILATRLRDLDVLSDIKAASLLRRLGELRLTGLSDQITAAARTLVLEGNRIVALRTLPYTLHRTDDGSGRVEALLEQLSTHTDTPIAETAAMLRAIRHVNFAPDSDSLPLELRTAVTLPDTAARDAAMAAYFKAATVVPPKSGYGDWENSITGTTSKTQKSFIETATAAGAALRTLYVRGAHAPVARSMILAALAAVPLQPPLFKAIRRIWQVAETVDDAEIFALLIARFDNERSTVTLGYPGADNIRRAYVTGGLVPVRDEAARPNARIAYTQPTRDYLRRRGWRTLRRLGQAGDPAYVTMAEAVLMTLNDSTDKQLPPRKTSFFDAQARQYREITTHYPRFPDRYAAHQIMHGAQGHLSSSPITLRWRMNLTSGERVPRREERFAELWDAAPANLWRLVTHARAATVVGFASRSLIESAGFIAHISTSEIAQLIVNWEPVTERLDFGISLAERRISSEGLKPELASALMGEESRGGPLVRLYLGGRSELLANDPALFAATLVGCAAGNHSWFDPVAAQAAERASAEARRDVLADVVNKVELTAWAPTHLTHCKLMATLLAHLFPVEVAALDAEAIRRLDRLESDVPRLVAAILAAARPDGPTLVDVARLAQSSDPDLRAAGVSLFAKRSIDELANDLDTVAAVLTADSKEPRKAARPIAGRIGRERPDSARLLAEKLLPALYRAEDHEGLREDVLSVLSNELRDGVIANGPDTTWALLRARSEPARRLGADVLTAFGPRDFSIRQIARIGCNDQMTARRWAVDQLRARIDDIRAKPEEGFALLDCAFEDAREAGYDLYRNELRPEDWSPEALVALSDSISEPAQRFGREMIGRVFEVKNAEFLLARLAEHPAPGFRLLVARLMRDYVKDDIQRLRRLVPTIETTLLQVRKSRAAKDQIFAFIEEQLALDNGNDSERMAILASVLDRTAATCAVADRARTLSLIASIKQRNPDLVPRAAVMPREARH
jgi:hypothetical protein